MVTCFSMIIAKMLFSLLPSEIRTMFPSHKEGQACFA